MPRGSIATARQASASATCATPKYRTGSRRGGSGVRGDAEPVTSAMTVSQRPDRVIDSGQPVNRDRLERQNGDGDLDYQKMERLGDDPERDDQRRGAGGGMRG